MKFKNSKGTVYYGLHFYPGVAEYAEPGRDPYRVFLNENTLRSMDASFAGRPVFVEHVDGVDDDVDELRKDADGWVIESFFNSADGKHWCKFIVVSERGARAIQRGMRLSNCYVQKGSTKGGLWNGVKYAREITSGEYEHLAIVQNPRYEESVILTPDEFKAYNEEHLSELKRVANEGEKESGSMKLNIFKRSKVENSLDLEGMIVVLPKSKKEIGILQLVTDADERLSNSPMAAHDEHLVDMGEGTKMTVNDLRAKCNAMGEELKLLKEKKENADDGDEDDKEMENDEDEDMENEDDADADAAKKAADAERAMNEKKKNELADAKAKADKKAADKKKADDLRRANTRDTDEVARVDLLQDQVARGKSRYGS